MQAEIKGIITNKYTRNDGSTTIEVTEKTVGNINGNSVSKIEINSGLFDMSGLNVLDTIHLNCEIMGSSSSKGFRWLTILSAQNIK